MGNIKIVGDIANDKPLVCPDCGAEGVFFEQTSGFVDGFFTIIDVYLCPVCHPNEVEQLTLGQEAQPRQPRARLAEIVEPAQAGEGK